MKKYVARLLTLSLAMIISLGFLFNNVFADENSTSATSIRLMPVNKILQIKSNSTYDESFEIFNDGNDKIKVEVYAAPYSYVYSDSEDLYKLGFSNENNFTQITRWISFLDSSGNYVEKPVFEIDANSSLEVRFRISTPDNIPAGGQYAVVFAHTLTGVAASSGIRTEASPGIVVYGRSTDGDVITSGEITDLKIEKDAVNGKTVFRSSAKIKNTGNIDFTAVGTMKVEPIIGFASYETEAPAGRLSVIPEAELALVDEWNDAPTFGVYKVTWTVEAAGSTEVSTRTIFLIPIWMFILIISLLTILVIWIIIKIRKSKERRSRLAI